MKNVSFVAKNGLCTGCGICVSICPRQCVKMIWDEFEDRVAAVDEQKCIDCSLCLKVCPGHKVDFKQLSDTAGYGDKMFTKGIGDFKSLDIFFSTNKNSYRNCTSGGIIRETVAYLLEQGKIDGTVMISGNKNIEFPFHAPSTILYNADEVRKHQVHSTYAPAPLLTILKEVLNDDKKYAIVGLPCHIHAIRNLQFNEKNMKDKFPYLLGLLCSGTPTGKANRYLFEGNKVDTSKIKRVDYRYGKWPKGVVGFTKDDNDSFQVRKMGGIKEQNRLFQMIGIVYMSPYFWRRRCLSCSDFFCKYADIVCGDPWVKNYWKMSENDNLQGGTLTIVRSDEMKRIIDTMLSGDKIRRIKSVEAEDVEATMGVFQEQRLALFKGNKKVASFFNMKFPEYLNSDIKVRSKSVVTSFINGVKARIVLKEKIWSILKYIQFIEESYKFLLRKIGLIK